MALEVRHNRAEHTHENVQFRRVAIGLKNLFEQKNWDGLLIGNPENKEFSRFRADAILLYNYGLMVIDFKDYQGSITMPHNDQDFKTTKWYNETEGDKQRIMIKAGSRFINPFAQLNSYRWSMKEIISSDPILNNNLDGSRICSLNIFSGPIEINREMPRSIPYYKIAQESDLHNLLYDYSSPNAYSDELATTLNLIFPAGEWEEHIEVSLPVSEEIRAVKVDSDIEVELKKFLQDKDNGVLVLESMDNDQRDDWMRYLLNEAADFGIPQTEVWTHSSRIARKIENRTGMFSHSLYNTVYGGPSQSLDNNEDDTAKTEVTNSIEYNLQEIVPLRSDDEIDISAVIILHEAHLITKSIHQTELLKFGSGRLLEDLMKFLNLDDTKRKLVCIGDPYSFSFGKEGESALSIDTLKEYYSGKINTFKQKPEATSNTGINAFRNNLATSIENNLFNSLKYNWMDGELIEVEKPEVEKILKEWYGNPIEAEPSKTILVYSHKDANKINLWIKRNCLRNSDELCPNDLLLVNNNINIPDDTGFGHPTKILNGMYLLVKEKKENCDIPIKIKQSNQPVILSFTKLRVQCLSLYDNMETDIWLMNNYFKNDSELSKNEQIAFRVLISQKIEEEQKRIAYENSNEYLQFQQDAEHINLAKEEQILSEQLSKGDRVKTKLEEKQRQIRKIERRYRRQFRHSLLINVKNTDPIINALYACYGWAITVHKSVGSTYRKVLLNAHQGETRGVKNEGYYRWLYSALTSSESVACIANPVEIDPLIDCRFEDLVQGEPHISRANKKTELSFHDHEIPDRFIHLIDETLNTNVKGCISELSKLLEHKGYLLENTLSKGEFLSKATYSIPESTEHHLILAINNNKKGTISSIRIEKTGGTNQSIINDCISSLKSESNQCVEKAAITLPEDFRKSIYACWKDKCQTEGWSLNLVEMHKFQDVFTLSQGNKQISFRVYYNNNGFLTKISVIKKTETGLESMLRMWLLNGE